MMKNIGSLDRLIRIGVAALIAVLYLTNVVTGTLGVGLLAVALVLALTSAVRVCPLYLPFGIRTFKTKSKGDQP